MIDRHPIPGFRQPLFLLILLAVLTGCDVPNAAPSASSDELPAASPSSSRSQSVPSQSVPSQSVPSQSVPSQSVPSQSASSQSVPSQLVLMTWNVEFLWDGVAPEDGDADFPWKGDVQAAEAHMADLAARIREVNPDILGLVEVENLKALETFRQKFLGDQGYRSYLVEGSDSATGQDVGLLSRIEIKSQGRDPRKGQSGSKRKAVSKHYIATADAGSTKLGIVGLHFLARPERENRVHARQAQADAVTRMARELKDQGRSVIVWGDFNDYDGAAPDRSGSRPITEVLAMIRAMDPRDPSDDLVNVIERLPRKQRYTVQLGRRNPRFTAVDHILLSPELAEKVRKVEIPHGQAWQNASDHFPVVVHLEF